MKTYTAKKEDLKQEWFVIDAKDRVLGRLAVKVANILRGKTKPIYTPHVDTGDNVVIINAEKVRLTGNKLKQKFAFRHSGYPGGDTLTRYDILMKEKPEQAILLAVRGMLPKNKLRAVFMKKLHVYKGVEHPHSAQQPKELNIPTN
ncbi:MAG: 50S ribosomal protein L13 [Elusimicrobiota bacterium]